jgi:ATP-binding cassette subfamily B protein
MKRLALVIGFWKRHPGWAVALVLATALVTSFSLAFPYLLRFIIDGIKRGVSEQQLIRYVLLLVGFGFLRAVGEAVLPFNRARVNERFQWITRNRIFRYALDLGHSFTNKFPTGDVMERLDHDLQELSWFVCSGVFRSVAAVFMVLFALGIMVSMNPLLTVVTVLPMGIGVIVWMKLGPLVYTRYMKWRKLISVVNNRIEAAFSGIRLVKGYNMEQRLGMYFRSTLDERIEAAVGTIRVESRIHVFYMAIAEIGLLLVLWAGGFLVVGERLTLGEFVAFNAYVLMLVGPMFDIGNLFVSGRRAQGGSERVGEIGLHKPEVSSSDRPAQPRVGVLELENVEFAYGDEPVLRNVSMKFPPGARIGIAGTVGSGKSTIFRLLFRLVDPQQGRVLLADTDVRKFDLDEYRRLFGYAPQEATLFSDTLENNVAFGRDVAGVEMDRVIDAAQFRTDLAGMTDGLKEMLGERGARLSGGQKERVAIARALVGKPRILVFDDATSALDAETEQELMNHLAGELGGSTVIIVSHRLSILSACDHVYVLDKGEVKEEGTHQELLDRRGLYWNLYERQLIKDELERL